jgi:hypothetical protein
MTATQRQHVEEAEVAPARHRLRLELDVEHGGETDAERVELAQEIAQVAATAAAKALGRLDGHVVVIDAHGVLRTIELDGLSVARARFTVNPHRRRSE